jgi:transcriptional regulator with XRE-family HTH domain
VPKFEEVHPLLQAARKKLGLTQEQFASALGIKLSRLQKWESGVNEPHFTIHELRRLRELNREVFDAMISGFLLVHASLPPQFSPRPQSDPPLSYQAGKREEERPA